MQRYKPALSCTSDGEAGRVCIDMDCTDSSFALVKYFPSSAMEWAGAMVPGEYEEWDGTKLR